MKKMIALLLALGMLLSLCACGEEDPTPASTAAQTTAPAGTTEPASSADMTAIETIKFTVSYPAGDGWVYEADDATDDDTTSIVDLAILDEDGYNELAIRIYADQDDPSEYRESLYSRGYDAYALVEENAYDFVTVGGQELLQWDNSYGDTRYYFGRNEAAGVNLSVKVEGDVEDARVKTVLDTLQFHLEDVGNVDGPWYWEGEPIQLESHSVMVGTYTLTSEFIPMAEPFITHETFDHDIEIVGDKAYILSDGTLKEYAYDGDGMTFVQDIALDDEFDNIDAAADGTLLLSGFMAPYTGYRDGSVVFSYDGPDYFAASPDGTWGLSYFTDPADVEKYTVSNGAMTSEPMPLAELTSVSQIWIDDTYIYVAGTSAETEAHTVFVYDHSGALQKTLEGEDGSLGSITFVTKTANGYLGLDGNMRSVVLWNSDGTYLGEADDGDLLGTYYPWFCAADLQSDGSIVMIMTEDRDDESAMELVAVRLTGF